MKTKTALIGSDGAVELDTVALVYMDLSVVVNPGNAEHNDALGLNKSFKQRTFLIFGMGLYNGGQRFENLSSCLVKFFFNGVFCLELLKHYFGIRHY